MRSLLPLSILILVTICHQLNMVDAIRFPRISIGTINESPEPESSAATDQQPQATEAEESSDEGQYYNPKPEPRRRKKTYSRPDPEPEAEPEPEPEPAINIKPPGLALKVDVPSLKIQLPALALPGLSLKATVKQPPHFLRLFPLNIQLPRLKLSTGIGGSFGFSAGGKGIKISTIKDRADHLEDEEEEDDWRK